MSWNQFNRLPYDSFIWRGIDGSTVVAHQLTAKSPGRDGWTTTCNAVLDAPTLAETWAMYQQKDQADSVLFTYGYGDGGGGPTTQMLETGRRIRQLGAPVALEHGTVQGYLRGWSGGSSRARTTSGPTSSTWSCTGAPTRPRASSSAATARARSPSTTASSTPPWPTC